MQLDQDIDMAIKYWDTKSHLVSVSFMCLVYVVNKK